MKMQLKTLTLALGTVAALSSGVALAESTYGYASGGTGTVVATARVNVSVTVPKLILLKVGTAGATIDPLSWTASLSIPAGPVTPGATADSVAVAWDGAAPTVTTSADPAAVAVAAWSNASTSSTLSCAVGALTAGGPALSDFTVTSGGGLAHTGANLSLCASTTQTFARNALATGSWTYALGGTPSGWAAGAYSTQITYTATGV